ncbi:serine hydrolase [Caulobacter sp. Root343]|nr:serine hydrolase [Caulobacter sp. Root342]KQV65554.1 serine hydrolase [Caulobacter sp. Root343]
MNITRRGHLHALTATLGLALARPALAANDAFPGTWTGVLDVGAQLTLRLVIDPDGVGLISVDQGSGRIPGTEVVLDDRRIRVVFKAIGATFEGALTDERHIDGVFTQGGAHEIRFTRGLVAEAAPEPARLPLTPDRLEQTRAAAGAPAIGAAWSSVKGSATLVAGLRSTQASITVKPKDQWHWGSITKSMTATLCARLAEAGGIGWDTTIGQVLDGPDYQTPAAFRDATLLHLLSHRAGLQPNVIGMEFSSLLLGDPRADRLKFARAALALKPAAALGARMIYSNNGYVIAGAMLEKVTGRPWEALIQAEVFAPLGVKHAGQGPPGSARRIDQPFGHTMTAGKLIPDPPGQPGSDNPVAIGPAGRVHMPLADMLTYLRAHRDRPARFLKPETWTRLHTPAFGDAYALGWLVRKDGGLWHNGSNTMWYGEVLVDPKTGVVCAACANDASAGAKKAVAEVLMAARAAALG